MQNQWQEARHLLEQALGYDTLQVSAFILAYTLMGELEARNGHAQKAEEYFVKGTTYQGDDFFKEEALYRYGVFLLNQNRPDEAEKQFQLCLFLTHNHAYFGDYGLALLAARRGKNDLALDHLEKSLERFFPMKTYIFSEPFFSEIRKINRFNGLITKHFSND